jgi:glycosyltransferase involved in cell wall biosynthesis
MEIARGRIEAGKGQDLLIKAWAIVTKQIPNAHLLIIGEGEQYSYLKALIDKLHLNSSVELLGWVRDQYQYIKNSQLVVHPTTWVLEGFGMVSVEALSLARPVVAFKFGPIPEIVDNKVGRLVKPNSIDDLANSIIALLANPPLCRKLGNAGYKKYLSHFTMDRVGRDFIKLFKEVAVDNKLT